MEYKCKTCNKNYKTRQSLWNHVNKYHKIDGQSKVSQTDLPVSQKSAEKDLPEMETENKYACKSNYNINIPKFSTLMYKPHSDDL